MSITEETYREKTGLISRELFEAIYELSCAYVSLEAKRKDRSGPPEQITDAAVIYREKERSVRSKTEELVSLHCKMLTKEVPPQ